MQLSTMRRAARVLAPAPDEVVMFGRHWFSAMVLMAGVLVAQGTPPELLAELESKRDDADVALVDKLSASGAREAAEGLAKVYDRMGSLLFRRAIVRALAELGTAAACEQPALTKLANIAGNDSEEELRHAAIVGLARSPGLGKNLLKKLVDAEAPDYVRLPALREHCKLAARDDADWYRFLWNLEQQQRKDSKGQIAAPELDGIRLLAFTALSQWLSEAELVETLRREADPKIRRVALEAMKRADMPKTEEMAEWVLSRVDMLGGDRILAARMLVEKQRAKAAPLFIELAKKRDVTTEDLRQELARLLAELQDDATDKKLVRLLGKGKPHERVFALLATVKLTDPKVLPAVRKELAADALEVRQAAARVIGLRRDREALPALRELLQKPKAPGDTRLAMGAIAAIEGNRSVWLQELVGLCAHADRDVRNAAVELLGERRDVKFLPTLLAALDHPDWSTRWAAIEAVAPLRDKQIVPKLIERLAKDQGRLGRRIGEVLWNLTAQAFEQDAAQWQAWWDRVGAEFVPVTEKELEAAQKEREQRRLRARTASTAKFFGLRVESRRVIFILDVSGSMLEAMYGRKVDNRPAARIDIAKQELSQAIANLEDGTLFNIFAFSNGVARWQEEGIGTKTAQSRDQALEWVERLGASGGTNLYDSVALAFEDPDVDTIFVLSDGQPTAGALIDPFRIRQDIAQKNEHRKIRIHTIAVGGTFEVLEWLAADSGGKHVQMR